MRRAVVRALLIVALLAALPACHQRGGSDGSEAAQADGPVKRIDGPVKGIDRSHKGKAAPATAFHGPAGADVTLATFKGRPLLVNLWASWCAPCVKELPTLDALARAQQGKLNVVAISQDDAPHASVVAFLKTHKIATLDPYQDPKMGLSGALNAEVLPTSILLDANGKEVWRYVGDQDWTSAAAAKLVAEGGVATGG